VQNLIFIALLIVIVLIVIGWRNGNH